MWGGVTLSKKKKEWGDKSKKFVKGDITVCTQHRKTVLEKI